MGNDTTHEREPSQLDKFKEAARDLETDDDEGRFKDRLGKLVKAPAPTQGSGKNGG